MTGSERDATDRQSPHGSSGAGSVKTGRRREERRPLVWLMLAAVALLCVEWGLGEFSESVTQSADLDAVQDVAAQRSPALTAVAHVFSGAGSGYVIFPLMVVLCALLYRRGRSTDALVVAVITLGATGMANLDKVLVGRPRPPVHHLEAVASASFPSGHATQASAFYLSALLILLAGRPPRALAIAAALATAALVAGVALSRVYLGVHYPSDVAGGLLLGATWSVLVRRATDHWGARGPVNVASEMRLSCAEAEPR